MGHGKRDAGHMSGLGPAPKAHVVEHGSTSDTHRGRQEGQTPDEVIVIDPATDTISKRVPIGPEMHLAHVVLTPDSADAYVTSEQKILLLK